MHDSIELYLIKYDQYPLINKLPIVLICGFIFTLSIIVFVTGVLYLFVFRQIGNDFNPRTSILSLTAIFGIGTFISLVLAVRNFRLPKTATAITQGEVVRYGMGNYRAPIVRYLVDGKPYYKGLNYSYIVEVSTPFHPIEQSTTQDLLADHLIIRSNSSVSKGLSFQERFPLGSKMKVYYNPKHPNRAFVERYSINKFMELLFPFVFFILTVFLCWIKMTLL